MYGKYFGDGMMKLMQALFFFGPTLVGALITLVWVSVAGPGLMPFSPLILGVVLGYWAAAWVKAGG